MEKIGDDDKSKEGIRFRVPRTRIFQHSAIGEDGFTNIGGAKLVMGEGTKRSIFSKLTFFLHAVMDNRALGLGQVFWRAEIS